MHPVWRTLLVDDNEDAAESLATLLRLNGHDVTTAYDGPTAIALQAKAGWDVLILDVGLPGMNGYELAAQLRESESTGHAKFIALSGYDRSVSQQEAGIKLFDHYLTKPVSVEDIEDLLVPK
jgi:CheY-like chemotaxis protein